MRLIEQYSHSIGAYQMPSAKAESAIVYFLKPQTKALWFKVLRY